MKQNEFIGFAERQGLSVVGSSAYGFMGNFPVAVGQLNGMVTIGLNLNEADVKNARKALKAPLKELKAAANSLAKDQLQIVLNPRKRNIDDDYRRTSDILLSVFQGENIQPVDRCPVCGMGGCDSAMLQGGLYRRIHRGCAEGSYQNTVQKADSRSANNNYLTGLVGALIGGLVAAMPAMLMIWLLDSVYGILYALIPLGAYHGYRNFKGKMDNLGVGIVVLVSIFYGITIDLLTVMIYFIIEGIPLRLFFFMLGEGGMLAEMIPDFIINLLFIGLGLFYTWRQISRTDGTELKEAGLSLETLRPLSSSVGDPRFGQPAPQPTYPAPGVPGPDGR